MTRVKPIDDVRGIITCAKLIARKMYKEKMRREGARISLTPVNLGAIHNRMLTEQREEIYAEARRLYEQLRPQLETNPRRTKKDRPRSERARGEAEAKPV
jgi:hypothetical protein